MNWLTIKQSLSQLFTSRCELCFNLKSKIEPLCEACIEELPWLGPACQRCALPMAQLGPLLCEACQRLPPVLDETVALFRYAWPLNQFIFQLKFQRQLYWAKYLGGLMAYYGTQRTLPQAWIPIPLALGRGQQRGYNQALELARPLSRAFNIPILWSICYRVKATSIQGQLTSYAARYRNLKQAFHITQCHLPAHVALVDDVVTSGATATALASALKAKGVARVDLWCCCRTIRKSVFI